ncbi:hypothetical protein Hdeb2414_s0089g00786911 [Helianthus debilis subsp. tardiflorus]
MEMEGGIDPDAPLDYVELQIFPCQNRYDAYVCSNNTAVKAASGTLKQLLLHSPRVKDLSFEGANMNFKVLPPDNVNDAEWFTTTTLRRFLHILGSPDIISIGNEITQLEETRRFQLSLSLKAVVDIRSSIDSKNELLRAVDLRLTALKDEVVTAFDQVTRVKCSTKDISDLENFAHHFGAKDIRDILQKFVEMSLFPTVEDSNTSITNCVSPKAAQTKRHNSTKDENASLSSDEDQASANRCRSATRSATPRRSASPMRRIQIGRLGSHRAPALTIKNLNHFPAREKLSFQRDVGSSSDEDDNDPDKPAKKNVLRMSVQDKISLFESKQRDQKVEFTKTKKMLKVTVGPNKAVLRRWSSGMGENATQNLENSSLGPLSKAPEPDPKPEPNLEPEPEPIETAENVKPHSPEREERCEKHPDSIEWNQQNEEKLNELLMKIMDDKNKPVRRRSLNSDVTKSKKSTVLKEVSCKQKKDENLRVEASGKKTQKNLTPIMNSRKEALNNPSVLKKTASKSSSLPATRKSWSSLPSPKTPTGPTISTTPTSRKPVGSSTKTEKSQPRSKTLKSTPPNANRHLRNINQNTQSTVTKSTKTSKPKVDQTPEVKPSFYNKVSKKSSVVPLETKPFLRKGSGIGPGVGPGVVKSKFVSQPEEASRSLIETEDNEVVMAIDAGQNEEKCEPQVVSPGPTKCEESVMISPTAWVEEVGNESDNNHDETFGPQVVSLSLGPTKFEEQVMISPTAWVGEVEDESDNNHEETCGPQVVSVSHSPGPTKCEESVMISPTAWVEVGNESDNNHVETCGPQVVSLSPSLSPGPGPTQCEESVMISPSAWVEEVEDASDDNHDEEVIPCLLQSESPVKLVAPAGASSSPRVRHSLSQMLLEESSEEADVSEWGNAEHPPALVYQKDSPKGFKRLLKFARKSKAESALLEADDDSGESKVASQNHSKVPERHVSASLNSTKGTRSFFSLSAFRASKTNESKLPSPKKL